MRSVVSVCVCTQFFPSYIIHCLFIPRYRLVDEITRCLTWFDLKIKWNGNVQEKKLERIHHTKQYGQAGRSVCGRRITTFSCIVRCTCYTMYVVYRWYSDYLFGRSTSPAHPLTPGQPHHMMSTQKNKSKCMTMASINWGERLWRFRHHWNRKATYTYGWPRSIETHFKMNVLYVCFRAFFLSSLHLCSFRSAFSPPSSTTFHSLFSPGFCSFGQCASSTPFDAAEPYFFILYDRVNNDAWVWEMCICGGVLYVCDARCQVTGNKCHLRSNRLCLHFLINDVQPCNTVGV